MKKLVKAITFILILSFILDVILNITNYKDLGGGAGWQRFYSQKKNTIDVLCFGDSLCHCTVDHSVLWDRYGLAGYSLTAGSQKIDCTYYFVKEALKYQHPSAILISAHSAICDEFDYGDVTKNRNTLGMKFSKEYMEFVHYLCSNGNSTLEEELQLMSKLPVVHSRYKELVAEDFYNERYYFKGYIGSDEIDSHDIPLGKYEEDIEEIAVDNIVYLEKIIDLCDEKGVGVVFFVPPYDVQDYEQRRYNRLSLYFEEKGVAFIDFNKLSDEIAIDYGKDLRDDSHLNDYGAEKVTAYLGAYLKNNYSFEDHTGDSNFIEWDMNSAFLSSRRFGYKLDREENLCGYLNDLYSLRDNYRITISLRGNYRALGDFYFDEMMQLGLTREQLEMGGTWCVENGIAIETIEQQSLQIVNNGVAIEVYDPVYDWILDTSYCNVYLGEMMQMD